MRLRISTDGGSRGNPGPAAAGIFICNERGEPVYSGGFVLGKTTNNVAEYQGLIHALQIAEGLGGKELDIACDSELVVKQVNGQYRVKNAQLKPLQSQVTSLMSRFAKAVVRHVRREQNTEADALVNEALDAGQDVGDAAEGEAVSCPEGGASGEVGLFGTAQPATEAEGEGVLAASLLPKVVRFDASQPVRQVLHESEGLLSELLCLGTRQRYDWGPLSSQATLTVLRGRGRVTIEETRRMLQPGVWLHLAAGVEASLKAAAEEELVILVTQTKR